MLNFYEKVYYITRMKNVKSKFKNMLKTCVLTQWNLSKTDMVLCGQLYKTDSCPWNNDNVD